MKYLFSLCVICLAFAAIMSANPLSADTPPVKPPKLDIPDIALEGTLLPMHVKQIKDYMKYYAVMLQKAKDDDRKAVSEARDKLVKGFKYSNSATYQYYYAQYAVEIVIPLLELPSRAKQVNVALALSKMPQVTIQPALEKMIIHRNPAVRYLGWKGYQSAWPRILTHGDRPTAAMFVSLATRAQKETSAPVVGAILQTLRLRSNKAIVNLPDARKRALKILCNSWPKLCRMIFQGDTEVMNAARSGLSTAIEYAVGAIIAKNKQDTTKAVQLIVDLMWCAGKAYQNVGVKNDKISVSIRKSAEMLLQDCEKTLNTLLNLGRMTRKEYLRFPLTDKTVVKDENRHSAVMYFVHPRTGKKYGVLTWVDFLKKKFSIRQTSIKIKDKKTTGNREQATGNRKDKKTKDK